MHLNSKSMTNKDEIDKQVETVKVLSTSGVKEESLDFPTTQKRKNHKKRQMFFSIQYILVSNSILNSIFKYIK